MRNFDETSITAAVVERLRGMTSTRTREINESLVRHLHGFIREIEPTQDEWCAAIDFLTATGQMCSAARQEFILLSDVLGASMLVDAINNRLPDAATKTTVLGPFYIAEPPEFDSGALISGDRVGPPLLVEGRVCGLDGEPIEGATVDTWHSDHEGLYDVQRAHGIEHLTMRARFHTDSRGQFWFRSIVPSCYPIPNDGPVGKLLDAQSRHPFRPAHVHFLISARGFRKLVTHVFIADDPYLDSDVVFGVKDALIRKLEHQAAGTTPEGHAVDENMAALRYTFMLANE